MASKRVNVLVYTGTGSTAESVRHCLYSLRRLLSPNYAVVPVTGEAIIKEPWSATCALLVFPGGADLGYCRTLNGEGNRRISAYVSRGGNYLGFCAGGYYGSKWCEFEKGDKKMEVVGDRELAFYPDVCRGLAFPGFVYNSEAGARAVELKVNRDALGQGDWEFEADTFKCYYNGGGVFVDAPKYKDRKVEVLASYTEDLHVPSGEGAAAIVYRKVGEGGVVLTGPHPEFAGSNLPQTHNDPRYTSIVEAVIASDKQRVALLKACLRKLGLKVNEEEQPVPSLSRIHLSAHRASDIAELVSSWSEIITLIDGDEYIKGENDTFHLEKPERWGVGALKSAVEAIAPGVVKAGSSNTTTTKENPDDKAKEGQTLPADPLLDFNAVTKNLLAHETALPTPKETPSFNHSSFFSALSHYASSARESDGEFGKYLLYGEVVTSTNTLLEKNPSLLRHLPPGLTFTATQQVAGRGRGSNTWVSPPGALIFSTVMRHSISLSNTAPVVFIQYLAALAIVSGIHNYDAGYGKLPVKLKWPNDIYALDPKVREEDRIKTEGGGYVKIGGILVNSSYAGSDYTMVAGIGMNVSNNAPTTTLNAVAGKHGLKPFQVEKLLAAILVAFEDLYKRFCRTGFDRDMEETYYRHWLHTDQIVTLESAGGVRARIKGITRDWGLLLAEELGWEDRSTGNLVQLQSDSNSFDFFKGLVKRKV